MRLGTHGLGVGLVGVLCLRLRWGEVVWRRQWRRRSCSLPCSVSQSDSVVLGVEGVGGCSEVGVCGVLASKV